MALYKYRIDDGKWDYFKDLFFFYQSFAVFVKRINYLIEEDVANEKEIYENYVNNSKKEEDRLEPLLMKPTGRLLKGWWIFIVTPSSCRCISSRKRRCIY